MEQSYFPDIGELAQRFGTPLYLYDFSHITRQYDAFKDAFAARKSLVAYALKANSNLSLVAHLAALGAGADCVSLGEVKRALLAGVAPYKIIFSGVGKQDHKFARRLELGFYFSISKAKPSFCVSKKSLASLEKPHAFRCALIPILTQKPTPISQQG